jgi:hypothetical protein
LTELASSDFVVRRSEVLDKYGDRAPNPRSRGFELDTQPGT